jgi:hypothetical protein
VHGLTALRGFAAPAREILSRLQPAG